jgi:hypothetical protein
MKEIKITLDDVEYEKLVKKKADKTWKEVLMDFLKR